MKKKELNDLRKKDMKSLEMLVVTKRADLAKTEIDIKIAREKNLKKAKNIRKDVAKLMSIIHEMKLADVRKGEIK